MMEQPQNKPQIAGDLTPEEKNILDQMKQRAQQIVLRIGSMEVEKARLLAMLDQQEQMVQQHLHGIGQRLNIPQGAGWQVANDKAVIINPAPPAPPLPANYKPELKVVENAPEAEAEPVKE